MTGSGPRPTREELQAAGLYDPDAPHAADRLALLEYLLDVGATVDDLVREDGPELPVLAATLALWSDRELLTLHELAERSGLDPALLARVWRAAGFPDPGTAPVFRGSDADLFVTLRIGVELLGADVATQFARVLGAAAARVAEAAISAFIVNVAPSATERDTSGLELARANSEAVALLPGLVASFDTMLRHDLERGRRRLDEGTARGVEVQHRSVGFVDLVGSTAFGEMLTTSELAAALDSFDATCGETIADHGGRLVKLIGDEVMFVANDPDAAATIALALIETFAAHDVLPEARGAVTTGDTVMRDGDVYGPVVNLAARAVRIAPASCVLVDQSTRDALSDGSLVCTDAGTHELKGFVSRVRLFRLDRAG